VSTPLPTGTVVFLFTDIAGLTARCQAAGALAAVIDARRALHAALLG